VVRLCILSYLQLTELFEASRVCSALTAVSRQAAVDWMQRAFASIVHLRPQLAQQAAEKKLQQKKQRSEARGRQLSLPEPAAAAFTFTFTLSDARFVRSEMQHWGAADSPSSRGLSEWEMHQH
jgi:hypothetical protein